MRRIMLVLLTVLVNISVASASIVAGSPPEASTELHLSPDVYTYGHVHSNDSDTPDPVAHSQEGKRVATDGNGLFIHVFNSGGNLAGQYVKDGVTVGSSFVIVANVPYVDQQEIGVAMNSAGTAVMAWNANGNIMVQVIPANTVTLSASPISVGSGDGVSLSTAINDSGNFSVAWSSAEDAYLKIFDAIGNPASADVLVSNSCAISSEWLQNIVAQLDSTMPSSTCSVRTAMNESGIAVVWNSGTHIYMQRYDLSAAVVGNPLVVDHSPADIGAVDTSHHAAILFAATVPNLSMNQSGDIAVAWTGLKDNARRLRHGDWKHKIDFDVRAQKILANNQMVNADHLGNPLDVKVGIGRGYQYDADIAINQQGDMAVIWENNVDKSLHLCVTYAWRKACTNASMPTHSIRVAQLKTVEEHSIKISGNIYQIISGHNSSSGPNLINGIRGALSSIAIDNAGNIEVEFDKNTYDMLITFTDPRAFDLGYTIVDYVVAWYLGRW